MKTVQAPRFEVELLSTGHDKEKLRQLLHQIRGLNASAPDIIESCPCIIATNISGKASKKLKHYLEQVGASVIIRRYDHTPLPPPLHSAEQPEIKHDSNGQQSSIYQARENLETPMFSEGDTPKERSAPSSIPLYQKDDVRKKGETEREQGETQVNLTKNSSTATSITLKRSVDEVILSLQDKDWTVRAAAITALSSTPSRSVIRHIITALKDDVWHVRCVALKELSHIGPGLTVKEMLKCIEDDVWHVRLQAVETLYRMESSKTIKPLLTALRDENWQIRLRAAQVLGDLRSDRSLNGLISSLQDDVWQVRESAAKALAQLHSEKSVKPLIRALHDPNWHVRSMVVTALWRIGSEKAIQALIDTLRDNNWMVHWKTAYTLGKIGTMDMLPVFLRIEQEKNSFLSEVARNLLRSFDIITPPQKASVPRLEYRSEEQYANMCYIPPGEFIMGHDEGAEDARPTSKFFLDGFFIDTYEVTNYQYKLFNPDYEYSPETELHPVINITWEEANEYARWIGKRLPTEAEWEKAARGPDGRIYPWGNEFDRNKCNTEESAHRGLTAVNQYVSGKSYFGVYDMIGNVLEWTGDYYKPYPWSLHDCPDFLENFMVLRGGSWLHSELKATCSTRLYAPAENKSNFISFRCVKDIQQQ